MKETWVKPLYVKDNVPANLMSLFLLFVFQKKVVLEFFFRIYSLAYKI